jgi:hypothetical protein
LGYGYTIAEGSSVEDLKKPIENGPTKVEGYSWESKKTDTHGDEYSKRGHEKKV